MVWQDTRLAFFATLPMLWSPQFMLFMKNFYQFLERKKYFAAGKYRFHLQVLLAFWPFVSFQEMEFRFPGIKLFSSKETFCWISQSLLFRQEGSMRNTFESLIFFSASAVQMLLLLQILCPPRSQNMPVIIKSFCKLRYLHFSVLHYPKKSKRNFFAQSPLKCRWNGPYCCRKLTVE